MNTDRYAVIAVTAKGAAQAKYIAEKTGFHLFLSEKTGVKGGKQFDSLKDCFRELFCDYDGIVAVMAQGIVTRMVSPLLNSKHTDPAIVVCDEVGRYAISAVSGHEGGANKLAHYIASITGAVPVITTATEANKRYIIGVGCRKGTESDKIVSAIISSCTEAGIDIKDVRLIASAWIKSDEQGLIDAADKLGIYLRFLPEHIFEHSPYDVEETAAANHFNIKAVAEPSALLAGFNTRLVLNKQIHDGVTVAIAEEMTLFT